MKLRARSSRLTIFTVVNIRTHLFGCGSLLGRLGIGHQLAIYCLSLLLCCNMSPDDLPLASRPQTLHHCWLYPPFGGKLDSICRYPDQWREIFRRHGGPDSMRVVTTVCASCADEVQRFVVHGKGTHRSDGACQYGKSSWGCCKFLPFFTCNTTFFQAPILGYPASHHPSNSKQEADKPPRSHPS